MNKKLAYLLLILLPITVISFFLKETNFIMPENKHAVDNTNNQEKIKTLTVSLSDKKETISLEEYVIGVVAGEMPALFDLEALKAQAIASRTYVINHLENHAQISSTISDQVYLTKEEMQEKWKDKYDEYYSKINQAVQETKGQIMYYKNAPIKAYYYSMSNGYTESSLNVFNEQNDYLNVVISPYDADNSHTEILAKETFCEKLEITCEKISIKNVQKDDSNRISSITINEKQFTGIQIRKKLSLRSTDFEISENQENPNDLKIITKGYGHGVGMSQHGANNMAKLGFTYEEILKYYYQNIEIDEL